MAGKPGSVPTAAHNTIGCGQSAEQITLLPAVRSFCLSVAIFTSPVGLRSRNEMLRFPASAGSVIQRRGPREVRCVRDLARRYFLFRKYRGCDFRFRKFGRYRATGSGVLFVLLGLGHRSEGQGSSPSRDAGIMPVLHSATSPVRSANF
jgi:hypothetical protein